MQHAPGARKIADLKRDARYAEYFAERPELDEDEAEYLRCFWELDTHRIVSVGFGGAHYNGIPVNAIFEYGRNIGRRARSLDCFVYLMRQLDDALRVWYREDAAKRDADKGGGKGVRPPASTSKTGQPRMKKPPQKPRPAIAPGPGPKQSARKPPRAG